MTSKGDMNDIRPRLSACGCLGCSGRIVRELSCRCCGEEWYCSENCKRLHWASGHKEECTKLDELLRLYVKAFDTNDDQATVRMVDACIRALGTYFSKRLRASDGDSLNFIKFCNLFIQITSILRPCSQFEDHCRIMSEVLDEAERLRQEGRLVMNYKDRRSIIKSDIQYPRAILYAHKARVLKCTGDLEASSAMFEQAVTVARGIEVDDPIEAKNALADVEHARAVAHGQCNEPHEAIRAYEEAYILRQENCSPDDIRIQLITKKLVELYGEIRDYEKVDYFAGILVENLEKYYRGQLNEQIGHILADQAADFYIRAINGENLMGNLAEYERLFLKAIPHLRSYEDRSSQRLFCTYQKVLKSFLLHISGNNRYDKIGDINIIKNIMNQYIDDFREHLNLRSAVRGSPLTATEEEDLKEAYRFLFRYYSYRYEHGPPCSKEDGELFERRKSEFESRVAGSSSSAQGIGHKGTTVKAIAVPK